MIPLPKRVRELAEVAKLQPYYDAQEIAIQAFSQLLIAECMKVCQDQPNSEKIVEAIKLHFYRL
jgi:hypothetical protein